MKRVLLAVVGTVLGLVALLGFKSRAHPLIAAPGTLPSAAAAPAPAATGAAPSTTTSAPPHPSRGSRSTASSSHPATHAAAPSSSAAATRKLVGKAIQTQYGVVQVAATVTGTHIASVSFVQLTAYDQRSQFINSQAAPILLHETIAAQSARIDLVSGASYTSEGYAESLQSALDQAGIK